MAGSAGRLTVGSEEYQCYQAACARLLNDDLSQVEIADRLKVSRSTVNRLMKDNVFIHREVRYRSSVAKDRGDAFMSSVDALVGEPGLRAKLSDHNPHGTDIRVKVVYPKKSEQAFLEAFADAGAARFAKWLDRARNIGVCWGGTLEKFILPTAALMKLREEYQPRQFLPVSGIISTNPDAAYYSATNLALRFQQELDVSQPPADRHRSNVYNLNCIPMRFPKGYADGEVEHGALQQYLDQCFPDYQKIFGSRREQGRGRAMISRLDTIVTGIGGRRKNRFEHLDANTHFPLELARAESGRTSFAKWGKATLTKKILLDKIVAGDIGGVLISRDFKDPHLQQKGDAIVAQLNNRLMTLNPSILAQCAQRSKHRDKNGVVVVAAGKHKAEALLRAIQGGFVSRVIIDDALAGELMAIV